MITSPSSSHQHCHVCKHHHSNLHLPHNHGPHRDTILSHIPSEAEMQQVADALRQLGDSNRLRIFWILCHCEECVINLSAMMNMSSPAVSHHLKSLKDSGLIVSRRAGKEMYYRAADTDLVAMLHPTIEDLARITCPAEEAPVPAVDETSQQKLITDIHEYLVTHLSERITIEELSHKYLINTSALKLLFKETYGLPIAAYMKSYRIQHAARLLRDTDEPIAVIASAVGYETQSKFTNAFKSVMQALPSEYRKSHR